MILKFEEEIIFEPSFSPDSRRLLVLRPHVPEGQNWVIHVALNWKTELEKRLGSAR